MNTIMQTAKKNTKILLILLWVFYSLNFMYADVQSSLEPGVLAGIMSGTVADGTVKITADLVGNRDHVRDSVFNDCPVLGIKVQS
jgi:hypothetical protein